MLHVSEYILLNPAPASPEVQEHMFSPNSEKQNLKIHMEYII